MTFKEGLIKARSHIVFILGLVVAFGIVIGLESWKPEEALRQKTGQIEKDKKPSSDREEFFSTVGAIKNERMSAGVGVSDRREEELSFEEKIWAKIAWKYFENNTQPDTGMVNSVDGYPSSTMWDTASYLMALICAERLEIIDRAEFESRLSSVLKTLSKIPLFDGSLPNKSYDTVKAVMTDYNNQPTSSGIGWSAIDIGRLLVPFNIVVWNYPAHTGEVKAVLGRWAFDKMVRDGYIYGAALDDKGNTTTLQEGRVGYEEYAAKSLGLMGWDVSGALRYDDYLGWVDIYGVIVPFDRRDPEKYHAHNYVVSEPYILDGLEFGWDGISRELAYAVYLAQEKRFQHTNILTAVSEDHIDQPPYFVYNTIFTDGKVWNCITEKGEDASRFKSISTKAVFGWHALYGTPYTQKLLDHVKGLFDPDKGWYSGRYESSLEPNRAVTCNTNGIVLESLCYKKVGRLIGMSGKNRHQIGKGKIDWVKAK